MHQVEAWIEDQTAFGEGAPAAYWWLKGLALLAYPIMPRFGAKVWHALGHTDLPTVQGFTQAGSPQPMPRSVLFRRLKAAELGRVCRWVSVRSIANRNEACRTLSPGAGAELYP